MRRLPLALAVATVCALPACTWVKMEPGGAHVQVAALGEDLGACTRRGEVGVSVKDKVGLYRRNELKVRDELETMARNEAAGLQADTIQALDQPSAGEQRFAAYTCGRLASRPAPRREPARAADPQPAPFEDAETFPVDDQ
jgi:hypothetical protein